jgi:N,N'-diacetyllegionaminate synthase
MEFKIGDRKIGLNEQPFCIAEVGINHNGDIKRAINMVKVAKESGADAVKFQTFSAEEFCGEDQKFTYKSQGKTITEPVLEMFKRYEFTKKQWFEIKKECDRQSIIFMSTPQNRTDLDLLLEIGIPAIKVGSDDLTNTPLIQSYSKEKLPLILSSGMSDLAEVYNSVNIAGGFDNNHVALLLCTSQYPTLPEEVNLARLNTLKNALPGIVIGFSDHTRGSLASSLAVTLGASILEKHFTLDHNLPGPDHWFSEDSDGLKEWVRSIRLSYIMQGSPVVRPTSSEAKNKIEYQRRLVAACDIKADDLFSENNITLRRVTGGHGFPPNFIDYLIGRPSPKNYHKDQPIEL